jgi:hypothetical protein
MSSVKGMKNFIFLNRDLPFRQPGALSMAIRESSLAAKLWQSGDTDWQACGIGHHLRSPCHAVL